MREGGKEGGWREGRGMRGREGGLVPEEEVKKGRGWETRRNEGETKRRREEGE